MCNCFRTARHCDKNLGVFCALALSAARNTSYSIAQNFPSLKIRALAVFLLNLGQLPAIAGNIPRFDDNNLILNIVIIFKYYYYIRVNII